MARPSTPGSRARPAQRGVTYLGLLLAVAITSGALAAGSMVWSHQQRRERETQLLWAGDQIRRALLSYAATGVDTTGSRYPARLEDLLADPRSLAPRRHLRRLYHDPMTHGQPWGLVRDERGGITAVFSDSDAVPIKSGGFAAMYEHFAKARSYRDWRFAAAGAVLQVPEAGAAASAPQPGASSPGGGPRAARPASAPPAPGPLDGGSRPPAPDEVPPTEDAPPEDAPSNDPPQDNPPPEPAGD